MSDQIVAQKPKAVAIRIFGASISLALILLTLVFSIRPDAMMDALHTAMRLAVH